MLEIYHISKLVINKATPKVVRQMAVLSELYCTHRRNFSLLWKICKRTPTPSPKINNLLILNNCNGQEHVVTCKKVNLLKHRLHFRRCNWFSESSWGPGICTLSKFSQNADSASPHTTHSEDEELGNKISLFFPELSTRWDTPFLCSPQTFLLSHSLLGTTIVWEPINLFTKI